METIEFKVSILGKRNDTVLAYETETPGLVVHRDVGDPKYWVVSHTASGLRLTSPYNRANTRTKAMEIAKRIGFLDWTVETADELRAQWDALAPSVKFEHGAGTLTRLADFVFATQYKVVEDL